MGQPIRFSERAIRQIEDMQKDGSNSEYEIREEAARGIDAVCNNASGFQGDISERPAQLYPNC
jgi:hypothetical protein